MKKRIARWIHSKICEKWGDYNSDLSCCRDPIGYAAWWECGNCGEINLAPAIQTDDNEIQCALISHAPE